MADVLRVPVLRSADPVVLAGSGRLDRPVRWVHSTELADIAPLLREGDLVLTTGVALRDDAGSLTSYAESLAASGAAGLVVELGRRWSALPEQLVLACERVGLPLVALRREVRFAAVTQAVGERLVDEQVAELRQAQRVHDTFTELSVAETGPEEILTATQQLAGTAVVLESDEHRVLDYRPGPGDVAVLLDDWERRSRSVHTPDRATWDPSNGWLVTRLGRRDRRWGRLVIESPAPPPQRLVALAERAAGALAMHRLHDRSRDGHVRRLHHELLVQLLNDASDPRLAQRVRVAGLTAEDRLFVGMVLRPARAEGPTPPGALDEVVTASLRAAERLASPALVAAFGSEVRVLLTVPAGPDPDRTVEEVAAQVRSRTPVTVAAGAAVEALPDAGRSLREALHVLASLAPGSADRVVHRLADLHVRGLLALLADDDRLRAFVDRELGPLRAADSGRSQPLVETTRVLVEEWGNKSGAAARLRVSRPVLYDRIARVERAIGASLADAEVRTSLHVALLAESVLRLQADQAGGAGRS